MEGKDWVAGDDVTVADFSLISSVSVFDIIEPVEPKQYPNLAAWKDKTQNLPYFEASRKGLEFVRKLLTQKLNL